MFISTTTIRVRYAETDQMKVVYHGNYAQYFEVGRVELIRQLGFSYHALEKMGIILPIVEWQAKFIRPALYDDLLTIKTIIKTLPSHHKIEFHQEIYNEQGELLTVGRVVNYCMEASSLTKTTIPSFLLEKLAPHFKA